ncbi:Cadherin-like, partial [Alteromonadaceae bacterium Bs31]
MRLKKPVPHTKKRRIVAEPLEARLLFSATADMVLLDDGLSDVDDLVTQAESIDLLDAFDIPLISEVEDSQDTYLDEAPLTSPERQEFDGELIFVDSSVEDKDALIEEIKSNSDSEFQVFTLDANGNGLEQISLFLAQYAGVKSVHLLSHGDDAKLKLGTVWLNNDNIEQHSEQMEQWQAALSDNADLLIYGCDLAANDNGLELMEQIAQATLADVAASNDATGNSEFGGDWKLESEVGEIDTKALFAPSWHGVLGAITANNDAADYWHGKVITGNVLTGDGGTGIFADSVVSAPAEITNVNYNGVDHNTFVSDELTINAYNGTLVMDRDGSFTFTSNGVSESAEYGNWEDSYVLYGYADGDDHTAFLSSDLDLGNATVTVNQSSAGLGNSESGSNELDNSEVIVIDLGADYTRADIALNSFGNGEDLDYTLFASDFSEVDTGSLSGDADGNVSATVYDNPLLGYDSFRYISIEPEDKLIGTDASLYIEEVSAYHHDPDDASFVTTELFTYTVDDNDADNGDLQTATLTLTRSDSNNAPTLTFSGTESEGQTLTATPADSDGTSGSTFNYQWQRSDNGNDSWSNIAGANSADYLLTAADGGKYVRANVSFTDDGGNTENVYSAASGYINSLASISISGTTNKDSTLSASVSDADGISGGISYQWERSADGLGSWTSIGSNQNYTLSASDVDQYVRVSASYTDDAGTAETPVSATTIQISDVPVATDDTASFYVGETLSGNVITGEGGTGINADTPGTGSATLSQIEYDSVTYSNWVNGELSIDTTNGTISFNQDGSYTYSPTLVGVGGDFEWDELNYTIYGFSMGIVYDTGSLNLGNADALPFGDPNNTLPELYASSSGLGIRYSDGNDHIGDNGIDSDVDAINAETEAVAIDFGADARIFQTTLTNFGSSETLVWTAYDSLGASVQSGTFTGSLDGSNSRVYSTHTVEVSGDFQYLVFTGDTSNAVDDDFRIYSITVLDNSPANLDFDYTLTDADGDSDIGRLSFTYTDDNNNPTPGSLTISGTTNEGNTLSSAGPTDTDGISGTVSYQWQRSNDGIKNWSDIGGETNSTHVIAGSDDGKYLRLVASYVDDQGTHESIESDVAGPATATNDAPSLGNSSFTVDEGLSLVITNAHISATDPDDNSDDLSFTVSNITNGEFQLVSDDTTKTTFTLGQINAGEIKFVHDGSEASSGTFDITVADQAGLNDPATSQVITVNATDDTPSLTTNSLTVNEGQSVVLDGLDFAATDSDNSDPTLIFTVSSVTNGSFQLVSDDSVVTSFTQQQVTDGDIKFVHNGTESAPSYSV